MAKIQIIKNKNDYIHFILKNVDSSVANAIRRVVISEVPKLAIDIVTFENNSTFQQEEYLAHRLGLIPICSTSKQLSIHENFVEAKYCNCPDECPRCSVRFECDVSYTQKAEQMGLKQDDPAQVFVTSADIILDKKWNIDFIHPVNYKLDKKLSTVAIVKLEKDQSLKFKATARLGIGKDHAKWSPVSIATFQFNPSQQYFDFYMESNGSFTCIEILKKSLQLITKKIKDLSEELKN
jgi:DNA-directed RNA polymerase II subunit RPB3